MNMEILKSKITRLGLFISSYGRALEKEVKLEEDTIKFLEHTVKSLVLTNQNSKRFLQRNGGRFLKTMLPAAPSHFSSDYRLSSETDNSSLKRRNPHMLIKNENFTDNHDDMTERTISQAPSIDKKRGKIAPPSKIKNPGREKRIKTNSLDQEALKSIAFGLPPKKSTNIPKAQKLQSRDSINIRDLEKSQESATKKSPSLTTITYLKSKINGLLQTQQLHQRLTTPKVSIYEKESEPFDDCSPLHKPSCSDDYFNELKPPGQPMLPKVTVNLRNLNTSLQNLIKINFTQKLDCDKKGSISSRR